MCLIEFTKRWSGLERFVCFSDLTDSGNTHPTIMRFLRWFLTVYRIYVFLATSSSFCFIFFPLTGGESSCSIFFFFFFLLWFARASCFDKLRLVTYM